METPFARREPSGEKERIYIISNCNADIIVVEFCQKIISEIKEAPDDEALRQVISSSIVRHQTEKINTAGIKSRYILNMIMMLSSSKEEAQPIQSLVKVSVAIEEFRKLYKEYTAL
ncbi:MAG: hypothetical protein ABI663_07425 [Chryseolinea sp.]